MNKVWIMFLYDTHIIADRHYIQDLVMYKVFSVAEEAQEFYDKGVKEGVRCQGCYHSFKPAILNFTYNNSSKSGHLCKESRLFTFIEEKEVV